MKSVSGHCTTQARLARGFSMIEVMVAILVMGIGLLGFALLQTMSVRFTQSANQRTQATLLATDLLDQVRANRLAVAQYTGDYTASSTGCATAPGASITPGGYKTVLQCRLNRALGAGARAGVAYADGVVTVTISWNDERWDDTNRDGTVAEAESGTTFTTRSRL